MTARAITVLIADAQPIYRRGLALALASDARLDVVAEASDGAAVLEHVRVGRPDVTIVQMRLPPDGAPALVETIAGLGLPMRVLVTCERHDAALAHRALAAGAAGVVARDSAPATMAAAVVAAMRGETVIAPGLQAAVAMAVRAAAPAAAPLLSDREREVLRHVAGGKTAEAIAELIQVTPATVRTHLRHIYAKLGVRGRAAAVGEGMRRGLVH